MKHITKFFVGTTILAIAACSDSNTTTTGAGAGGGGAGGSGGGQMTPQATLTAFDTSFSNAQMNTPTQAPITGSANYDGQVSIVASGSGTPVNIVGDLALAIDFAGQTDASNGTTNNLISGTASNFKGEIDGTDVEFSGELTTANSLANGGINTVTAQTISAPIIGNITTTGIGVGLRGNLTETTTSDMIESEVILQGNMTGTNGAGSFGAAGGFVRQGSAADQLIGGQYYLEKQ